MKSNLLPLNLQRFADPAPEAAPEAAPPEAKAPETKTFTQDELDAVIEKRLARERKDMEAKIKAAATEAEKLAKMNAEERAQHERQELENTLKQREHELTKRELRAQALELLGEKGLPRELADVLPYSDADGTNAALTAMEKVFRAAVEKGVTDRLRSDPPKVGQPAAAGDSLNDEIYKGMFRKK